MYMNKLAESLHKINMKKTSKFVKCYNIADILVISQFMFTTLGFSQNNHDNIEEDSEIGQLTEHILFLVYTKLSERER